MANHVSTMRIRIDESYIADISYVSDKPYNILNNISIDYDGIKCANPYILAVYLMKILGEPFRTIPEQIYRWEKDFLRLHKINMAYPIDNSTKDLTDKMNKKLDIKEIDINNIQYEKKIINLKYVQTGYVGYLVFEKLYNMIIDELVDDDKLGSIIINELKIKLEKTESIKYEITKSEKNKIEILKPIDLYTAYIICKNLLKDSDIKDLSHYYPNSVFKPDNYRGTNSKHGEIELLLIKHYISIYHVPVEYLLPNFRLNSDNTEYSSSKAMLSDNTDCKCMTICGLTYIMLYMTNLWIYEKNYLGMYFLGNLIKMKNILYQIINNNELYDMIKEKNKKLYKLLQYFLPEGNTVYGIRAVPEQIYYSEHRNRMPKNIHYNEYRDNKEDIYKEIADNINYEYNELFIDDGRKMNH